MRTSRKAIASLTVCLVAGCSAGVQRRVQAGAPLPSTTNAGLSSTAASAPSTTKQDTTTTLDTTTTQAATATATTQAATTTLAARDSLPTPNPSYRPPALVPVDSSDFLPSSRDFTDKANHLRTPGAGSYSAVPKSVALTPVDGNGSPVRLAFRGVRPLVYLARYTNDVMTDPNGTLGGGPQSYKDRLVWAVIWENISPTVCPRWDLPMRLALRPPRVQVSLRFHLSGLLLSTL